MKYRNSIALTFILVYIAAFSYICFDKYQTFSYYDADLADVNQTTWNSLHGRMLQSTIHGPCSALQLHATFILILLLPLYALWQSPLMLLYLQTIAMGFSGWPLYRIAREELRHGGAALVMLAVYLLYPALGYINLFHVQPVNFALLPLGWAYYFFRHRSYAPFLSMLGIAMSSREEVALVAVAFGMSALWERRALKWWLVPLIGGMAWFTFYFFWLAPHLRGGSASPVLIFYADVGGSAGGLLKNLLFHPLRVLRVMCSRGKILFLFRMLAPLAFTPLLSPGILFLGMPNLVLNLLSSRPYVADIIHQYNCPIIPFIFFAGVAGLARLMRAVRSEKIIRASLIVILFFGIGFSWSLGPQLHLLSHSWKGLTTCLPERDYLVPLKWELVRMIPPRPPVTTTFGFFAQLSSREALESLAWVILGQCGVLSVPYTPRPDIEYALVNFGDPTTFVRFYDPAGSPARFRSFLTKNSLGLIAICDQIALFRRGAPDILPLYERVGTNKTSKPIASFEGLDLTEARLEVTGKEPERQIRFTSLWRAAKKLDADLSMMIRVTDAAGRDIFPHQVRNICYHLYPTWEWPAGETICATHLFALPPSLPPGRYVMKAALINKFPPCRARQCEVKAGYIDRDGWYIAGAFGL